MNSFHLAQTAFLACCIGLWMSWSLPAQIPARSTLPEQRMIDLRDPSSLRTAPIPDIPAPYTVIDSVKLEEQRISLDEAIQIALREANVIRVLTGVTASSSGRTIYDVAIVNTDIDQQNSFFDPNLSWNGSWTKTDQPSGVFDPGIGSFIVIGSGSDGINNSIELSQKMLNGADVSLNVNPSGTFDINPGSVIDPVAQSSVEMALRQPFLRGYGRDANLTPIIVARINTERSFFQYKDSVQELVRGVIAAYWALVAARVDVWARQQQVEQAEFAYQRALARKKAELDRAADVAQARSALANFRAGLIAAKSNLILSETALRNILRMDPSATVELVPTSTPILEKVQIDWQQMLELAEQNRPDIIELKLILDADEQLLRQANNTARPQLDGVASYRWDGLEGELATGALVQSQAGQFTGWNVGVNFSVPFGLRQSRAALRRQELILARDQINLDQGVYSMVHQLAVNYRNIDQFFAQISAFKAAREAARANYENQVAEFRSGRRDFLNVLQAITDWGNAVSQEAQSITQYNTELANIERQTGTILETHGITFFEERYGSIGPLGRLGPKVCYPAVLKPEGAVEAYPDSGGLSDEAFRLENLSIPSRKKKGPQDSNKEAAPQPPDRLEPPENDQPPNFSTRRSGQNRFSRLNQKVRGLIR
jgi:outer membrane protein TolC